MTDFQGQEDQGTAVGDRAPWQASSSPAEATQGGSPGDRAGPASIPEAGAAQGILLGDQLGQGFAWGTGDQAEGASLGWRLVADTAQLARGQYSWLVLRHIICSGPPAQRYVASQPSAPTPAPVSLVSPLTSHEFQMNDLPEGSLQKRAPCPGFCYDWRPPFPTNFKGLDAPGLVRRLFLGLAHVRGVPKVSKQSSERALAQHACARMHFSEKLGETFSPADLTASDPPQRDTRRCRPVSGQATRNRARVRTSGCFRRMLCPSLLMPL